MQAQLSAILWGQSGPGSEYVFVEFLFSFLFIFIWKEWNLSRESKSKPRHCSIFAFSFVALGRWVIRKLEIHIVNPKETRKKRIFVLLILCTEFICSKTRFYCTKFRESVYVSPYDRYAYLHTSYIHLGLGKKKDLVLCHSEIKFKKPNRILHIAQCCVVSSSEVRSAEYTEYGITKYEVKTPMSNHTQNKNENYQQQQSQEKKNP